MFVADIQQDGTMHYVNSSYAATIGAESNIKSRLNNSKLISSPQTSTHLNEKMNDAAKLTPPPKTVPGTPPSVSATPTTLPSNPLTEVTETATAWSKYQPEVMTSALMPSLTLVEGFVPSWFTTDRSRLAVLTRNYLEGRERECLPVQRRKTLDCLDMKVTEGELFRMRMNAGLEK